MGDSSLAPIAFNAGQNTAAAELGGAMPLVVNVVPDAAGVVRCRPGIKAWSSFGTATGSPVIGMSPFSGYLVYVTADRKIHAVTPQGNTLELSDDTDATKLAGAGRPTFASGRVMLVMAGGGAMQKWTGDGLSARLVNKGTVDVADPPDASFICAIAKRLVAQVPGKSGQLQWSGPLEDYENWDMAVGGAAFIQADAKPDPLVSMADNTNEIFAFGSHTLQVFAPSSLQIDPTDANNILDFAPSRTMQIGTVSPFGICPVDDTFAMLDRQRRIVITDARSYNDVSKPIFQAIRDMKDVTNAWAFRMRFARFDCVVWMFPTDGFGLIYDISSQTWCEWRAWNAGDEPVTITSAYNWAEQNVFLVGLSDGSVAQLDDQETTDLGAPIIVELVSGFTSHSTSAQKACKTLMLSFKRTWSALPAPANGLSPSGHVRVSMRDNEGAWKIIKDIELSSSSEPCLQIRSLGVYRTRQWRIQYTGRDEVQLVSAQEEYEVLGA
jgi:hypothetical protein